jgi:hypothetical protein
VDRSARERVSNIRATGEREPEVQERLRCAGVLHGVRGEIGIVRVQYLPTRGIVSNPDDTDADLRG